jgi:hypothetical protein
VCCGFLQLNLMAWAEIRRWADINNPGSVNQVRHRYLGQTCIRVKTGVLPAMLGPRDSLCHPQWFNLLRMHLPAYRQGVNCHLSATLVLLQDPIFTSNKLPANEVGYPGGIFDPFGWAKDPAKVSHCQTDSTWPWLPIQPASDT